MKEWIAAVAIVSGVAAHRVEATPSRQFATEVACSKAVGLTDTVCRRAFAVATAIYLAGTRNYPSRFGCYRAYGPCMPWPAGHGGAARFRPQWMGVALSGASDALEAVPVLASGKVRLALAPRALTAPLAEASVATVDPPASGGTPSEAAVALCRHIDAMARQAQLPPDFLARLLWQESSFRFHVVSPAGAQGIAQFMPGTASDRGLADPFDPVEAIRSSATLLGDLANQFGNLGLAAAAYNGGPARVADWLGGRRTLATETEDYVLRVTGRSAADWRGRARNDLGLVSTPDACLGFARRVGPTLTSPGNGSSRGRSQELFSIGSPSPTISLTSSATAR